MHRGVCAHLACRKVDEVAIGDIDGHVRLGGRLLALADTPLLLRARLSLENPTGLDPRTFISAHHVQLR
jgi:hypothetical protein